MSGPSLTWVAQTPNVKTGNVPTAYVGQTLAEARGTCRGCPLLDNGCYAWVGMTRLSMGRIEDRRLHRPEAYTLENALAKKSKGAIAARIGALGDPGRADRAELFGAVEKLRAAGLAVLAYTHFWGEPGNVELRDVCMASCEDANDAAAARALGFRPAVLLPWDHVEEVGESFRLGDGSRGVVCPAQTRDKVTCNSCRMCDPQSPVWKAGRISAIGFLDHSPVARGARKRAGKQLPLLPHSPDVRPPSRSVLGISPGT